MEPCEQYQGPVSLLALTWGQVEVNIGVEVNSDTDQTPHLLTQTIKQLFFTRAMIRGISLIAS
jgi:hypothetical protein